MLPKEYLDFLDLKLKKFRKMAMIIKLQGASAANPIYLWTVFAESILGYRSFIFAVDNMTDGVVGRFERVFRKSLKYTLGLC